MESERQRLALGVGYVLFHAWRKSSAAIRIDTQPEDFDGWAALSRDIVLSRLNQFSRDLLVLAMNHVVYVESMAGLEGEHTVGLVAALRAQAGETGLYRLFDTLGWREFLQVVRSGPGSLSADDRKSRWAASLRDPLQIAVLGSYRDHEVEEHLRSLGRLGPTGRPCLNMKGSHDNTPFGHRPTQRTCSLVGSLFETSLDIS